MAADQFSQLVSSASPHQPGQPASMAPEQRPEARTHRRGGSFGSFDLQDLVKASSAGDFSLQDFMANADLAEAPSWIPQTVNNGAPAEGPSPLLRWTSDGSMMEELLKTFPDTPRQAGQQGQLQPSGGSLNGTGTLSQLSKDASIGAVLAALMAQTAAEEAQAQPSTSAEPREQQQELRNPPPTPELDPVMRSQPAASSGSSQSSQGMPFDSHKQMLQSMPQHGMQHGAHGGVNSRMMRLPPPDPTVPSSRGSLTFPILGNPGSQPGMRQLRIVPAPAPSQSAEAAADSRHQHAHSQATPTTSYPVKSEVMQPAEMDGNTSWYQGSSQYQSSGTPSLTADEQAILQAAYASAGEQVFPSSQSGRSHMLSHSVYSPSSFLYPPQSSQQQQLPLNHNRSASYQEPAVQQNSHPLAQPRSASLPGALPDMHRQPHSSYASASHHSRPMSHHPQAPSSHQASMPAVQLTSQDFLHLQQAQAHQENQDRLPNTSVPGRFTSPVLPTSRVIVPSPVDISNPSPLLPSVTGPQGMPGLQQHAVSPAAHAASSASHQMDMSSPSDYSDAGGSRRPWSAPVQFSSERMTADLEALIARQMGATAAEDVETDQPLTMDVCHLRGLRGPPKRERSMNSQRPPVAPKRTATASGAHYATTAQQQQPPRSPYEEEEARALSADFITGSVSLPDPTTLDKKAVRKEKNRASAAASRARREAYTQSLEEEVKRLQSEKQWLEEQVNPLLSSELCLPITGTAMPARPPLRHLSI